MQKADAISERAMIPISSLNAIHRFVTIKVKVTFAESSLSFKNYSLKNGS